MYTINHNVMCLNFCSECKNFFDVLNVLDNIMTMSDIRKTIIRQGANVGENGNIIPFKK